MLLIVKDIQNETMVMIVPSAISHLVEKISKSELDIKCYRIELVKDDYIFTNKEDFNMVCKYLKEAQND